MNYANFRWAHSLALLALLAMAGGANGQEDSNAKIMDMIYSKFRIVCGDDPKQSGKPETSTLILYRPGYGVDFNAADKINEKFVEERLSVIANRLPHASYVFQANTVSLEDVWGTILNSHETPAASFVTPAQQQELDKAKAFLIEIVEVTFENEAGDDVTKKMTRKKAYQKFQSARIDASVAFEADKDTARTTRRAPNQKLKQAFTIADDNWTDPSLGNKLQYEKMLETINESAGKDPKNFFAALRDNWKATEYPGSKGPLLHSITFDPSYDTWDVIDETAKPDKDGKKKKSTVGWTTITMSSTESSSASAEKSFSASAAGSGSGGFLGLFSVSAKASTETKSSNMQIDGQGVTMTCEVRRVLIDRPWMNGVVFGGTFWRFDPKASLAASFVNLSEGKGITGGELRNTNGLAEVMPLVPTELLLARNVMITGNFGQVAADSMSSTVSGGGSMGFGPFYGGSAYAKDGKLESHTKVKIAANSIEFEGMQVIGVICAVQKKIPNPDPGLFTSN